MFTAPFTTGDEGDVSRLIKIAYTKELAPFNAKTGRKKVGTSGLERAYNVRIPRIVFFGLENINGIQTYPSRKEEV